jgi:hypothetical protein
VGCSEQYYRELALCGGGLLLIATLVAIGIFTAGFRKYGLDFIKHGSKKKDTVSLGEKIDGITARLEEFHAEMEGIHTELQTIQINHFGRLKDFLSVLRATLIKSGKPVFQGILPCFLPRKGLKTELISVALGASSFHYANTTLK